MKNGKVSGGWGSEKKRVRKRMEERENGGIWAWFKFFGRKEASTTKVGLTQHRHDLNQASGRPWGTHHLDFLGLSGIFGIHRRAKMNFTCPRRGGIGQAVCLPAA